MSESEQITVVSSGIVHDDGAYTATHDKNDKATISLVYKVVYSAPVLNAGKAREIALAAGAIPAIGAAIPGTSFEVTSLQFSNLQSSPTVWKVVVEHGAAGGGGGGSASASETILEGICYDPEYKVNARQAVATCAYECDFRGMAGGYHSFLEPGMTEAYQKASGVKSWKAQDADGNDMAPTIPIVNTAGDKYADPVMIDCYSLSLSWWQLAPVGYDPTSDLEYIGSLCNGAAGGGMTICGLDMGTDTVLRDLRPEPFIKAKRLRWKMHFTVEKKLGGNSPVGWWAVNVLCAGFNRINNSGRAGANMTAATPITKIPVTKRDYAYAMAKSRGASDEQALKDCAMYRVDDLVAAPVLLNENGDMIAADGAAPVLQCFRVNPRKNWAAMKCRPAAKMYKQDWNAPGERP